MTNLKKYLLARLSEPSTWRGIVDAAIALGATLSPAQAESVVVAGIALRGLLGAFLPDNKNV